MIRDRRWRSTGGRCLIAVGIGLKILLADLLWSA
jgi:hypothetical protein